jgi:acyl transferase domain-containing protein
VNSLGVGGTNAHAVLKEAPPRAASEASDWPFQPLVISARSKAALDAASARLAAHLRAHPDQPLADVAWTLKEGRRAFDHRRVVVAESHEEAAALLESGDRYRVFTHTFLGEDPRSCSCSPVAGRSMPAWRATCMRPSPCSATGWTGGWRICRRSLDYDIRARSGCPSRGQEAAATERLKRPSVQLPLIFITEIALAHLWMSWGVGRRR